ncbi:DUF1214 domain-containing protein [Mycolicibacterium sp. 050232]|uniref:DUF1214 domain-containing protein n=1 Tax=Mycolicibacterium sp. 050232 TaxID=3113982 RepID=UPI002E2BC066|nr:DUF1214 domain-containing protein [Mycolicibacterium sp. 050232]MED5811298.1 DUF1214 domain-containing protein [Mycolicibacterium sp. 050232]
MTAPSAGEPRDEVAAWNAFVDGLRTAGEQLAADTANLPENERADGFRALLRAVSNQLGRFEVDRDKPEFIAFNGWRQKFLMDNPDFQYWVADVRPDGRYRIRGNRGDAAYVSVTVYGTGGADTQAVSRIDSDAITFDEDGGYEVTVGDDRPPVGDWLGLPERATVVWVRHFHDEVKTDRHGWCGIEAVEPPPSPAPIDPARFGRHLSKASAAITHLPRIWTAAAAADRTAPNQLRHWDEMTGGAVFTEPAIHYLRGGWQLEPGEALLIEGGLVPCRYWNILAYSRFLNSLDYRHRRVSYTGATANLDGGRYRFVISATDPGPAAGDWIDSEGRAFGIVVMRFLQPEGQPTVPSARVVRLADLVERS